MAAWLTALAGSYVIGSIPTAYLIVRRLKHIDIRTVGSGNVGATNVTRTAGKGAGIVVFVLDLAKGLVAVLAIAHWLDPNPAPQVQLACGLAAVIGHVAPVFLKFRGGKGVATTIGVLTGVYPQIALVCGGIWLACFLASRYVSLSSIGAIAMLPLMQRFYGRPLEEILLGAVLAILIIANHRGNIERLKQGTEHRFAKKSAAGS